MQNTDAKPFVKKNFTPTKQNRDEFQTAKHFVVGKHDVERRNNLLRNAELGMGKAVQKGKHLLYTVGSVEYGFIEYLIVDASLPTNK